MMPDNTQMIKKDTAAAIELLMANFRSEDYPKGLNPKSLANAILKKYGEGVIRRQK